VVSCLLVTVTGVVAEEEVPVPPLESGFLLILHPICVHFALALTLFGLGLDWVGSRWRQTQCQYVGRCSFFAGVVALGFAVISGWIEHELPRPTSAFDQHMQPLLLYHEYLGYGLLGFFIFLTVLRVRIQGRLPVIFLLLAAIGAAGLIVQGYLGGELVYRYGAGVRAVQVLSHQLESEQKKAPE
jgi:uncharacterized membrane protein